MTALMVPSPMVHGGDIISASQRFDIPLDAWQDLSTGISPWSWPVPDLPEYIWTKLPDVTELLQAARSRYGISAEQVVATAGSQVAIRTIPSGLAKSTVAIPLLGYQEHRYSWQLAGHTVVNYQSFDELCTLLHQGVAEHAVLINPNNPTAERVARTDVLALQASLNKQQLLLVDEAFAEVENSQSLLQYSHREGLVVLRSVGKFFGLAGLRLGFAAGNHSVLQQLQQATQPWGVSGPAIYIGAMALNDGQWQHQQRQRIQVAAMQLLYLAEQRFPACKVVNGGLFVTVFASINTLQQAYEHAARHGVLLRHDTYSDNNAWLRIGLADDNFKRLQRVWCGENNAY